MRNTDEQADPVKRERQMHDKREIRECLKHIEDQIDQKTHKVERVYYGDTAAHQNRPNVVVRKAKKVKQPTPNRFEMYQIEKEKRLEQLRADQHLTETKPLADHPLKQTKFEFDNLKNRVPLHSRQYKRSSEKGGQPNLAQQIKEKRTKETEECILSPKKNKEKYQVPANIDQRRDGRALKKALLISELKSKESEECTFHPSISSKSKQIVEECREVKRDMTISRDKFESATERKNKFKPKLNENSRRIVEVRSLSKEDRYADLKEERFEFNRPSREGESQKKNKMKKTWRKEREVDDKTIVRTESEIKRNFLLADPRKNVKERSHLSKEKDR